MKKFVFFLFHIFIAIGAYADVQFTITCDDTAGNGCKIDGNYNTYLINRCSDISGIAKDKPIIIDTSKTGSICSDKIKSTRDCSTMGRYVNSYYVVFCEDTEFLDTIGTRYDGITDINLSYAEKKCRGSGGDFKDGKCTCPNPQTTPSNGECLCTAGNTKYLVGNSCNEGAACISTGGDPKDDIRCDCPEHMSAVKLRNTSIEVCECNNGYQYRDPMRRWEGCVEINKTITISGTVQDHDSHETLPAATISIIDGGNTVPMGGTSNPNGSFTIQNVPNTAYVKFSYVGYKSALYAATDLQGSIIKLKSDPYTLNEITITPSDEHPTTTTNPTQGCKDTGGTDYDAANNKCICPADKFLEEYKYKDKYSICRCMNGYHRVGKPDGNGKYAATGECVYAPETQTKIERDDMAMQRDAEDAYRNEYDNAQSWANKGTTALSTLMTGEGAMMAARAIAEKIADDDAEREMAEYVSKMKCEYGGGQSVNLGDTETLPGGNELANYYAEYKQLADKLKATKAALNLRPGIEAEVLYDRAETGLYQYQTAERQSGGFTSLSRALMNPEGADAEQWNAQRAETNRDLLIGGALATTGLVGSYIANRAINKDHVKKYKELEEKFMEIKKELLNKYPEVFEPVEQEVTIEEVDKIEAAAAPEPTTQLETKIDLKVKSEAFKSGYATLTQNSQNGINEAIQKFTNEINNYSSITNIEVETTGHADPLRINSDYINKITRDYQDNFDSNYLRFNERITKIKTNEDLTKARAQMVAAALLKAIKEQELSPNVSINYTAIGTDGKDCNETNKTNYEKCRYVEIIIKITGLKKSN